MRFTQKIFSKSIPDSDIGDVDSLKRRLMKDFLKHEEPLLGDVDRSQFGIADGMIPESGKLSRRKS
jgi:hypothetical protein